MVAQSEERLTQLEYQLRESRRELDDKVATKSREIDAQEAHFSAELVSHTDTSIRRLFLADLMMMVMWSDGAFCHESRSGRRAQLWSSRRSYGMPRPSSSRSSSRCT